MSRPASAFAIVALAYAGGAQLAYAWFGAGLFPVFFPAAGVTLAALVLCGRRLWPFVLAGAGAAEIAVDLAHGSGVVPAIGWAVANLTEATAGASLLLYACRGRRPDLSRRRDLIPFLLLPVACSPALGGLIGAANAELFSTGAPWPEYVLRWWVGDGLGVLVVGGTVIALARSGVRRLRERWAEAAGLTAAATLATVMTFAVNEVPWAYVPFLVLPWIALRLGTSAVAIAGALVAAVAAQEVSLAPALWDAIDVTPRTGILYVQAAIATMIATALLLAAEAGERYEAVRERARLDEERRYEHAVAVSLQRALLPERLVESPQVEIAAVYRPSDERLEVGGDWYETLSLSEGRIGLAVGDVVGHGLDAARAMGQMRTAVAALAPDCATPVELLDQLDEFAAKFPAIHYSTACYATLDPASGAVEYASAGHPPILLVDPRGGVRYLDGGLSWPLCSRTIGRTPPGRVVLEPGAVLILYSDGLIERRGEVIDAGLERLAAAADRHRALAPEALCEVVVAELAGDRRIQDDLVVVAARLLAVAGAGARGGGPNGSDATAPGSADPGPGQQALLDLELPARAEAAAAARKAMASLNGSLQLVSAERLRDVQLLVTEVVTNAVRHGSQEEPAVSIAVRADERVIRVEVTDRGGGFDPERLAPPPKGSGWGLQIVSSLAHGWGVERGEATTVWFEIDRPQKEAPLPADPTPPSTGSGRA